MSQKILHFTTKWLRFNAIGAMGVAVQLLVVIFVRYFFDVSPFVATFIAIQFALIHNFVWHQRWTWRNNRIAGRKACLKRFVRFHSSSGTISVVGTLGFTALLLQTLNLPYVVCNLMAIGACNIANFLFSHTFVFQAPETV